MEFHEVANIFPLLEGEEYRKLRDDIKANGLIEPIWTYESKILDGRNRYTACLDAGIEPHYKQYTGSDPISFVVSLNLARRHLTSSQLVPVAIEVEKQLAIEAKKRQQGGQGGILLSQRFEQANEGKATEQAAKMVGTNRQYVSDGKKLAEKAPELLEQVRSGEITIPQAKKELRSRDIQKQVEQIEQEAITKPTGLFDVIVIDPPWPYGTEYDPNGRRAANPYPEMSLEQIKSIELPAKDDCVLWLWTTHKFMRYSFEILDTWGFRDVAILTWAKDRMGLGTWLRSQSEFCIMAVRGKPIVTLTNQTTVINGPLREHSRKPDEFYAMVNDLCHGEKLDYFSREKRAGWYQFGNETELYG